MQTSVLTASPRPKRGKSAAKSLRRTGKVPAVAYSAGTETISFSLDERELMKTLTRQGKNVVIQLQFEDKSQPDQMVMLKVMQRHPVKRHPLHADFIRIDINKPIQVSVPFEFTGRAFGTTRGGFLSVVRHKLQIECLPTNIPNSIQVDVSGLDLNQALHVSDLRLPEEIKTIDDARMTIVTVSVPSSDKEEKKTEEEAAATTTTTT